MTILTKGDISELRNEFKHTNDPAQIALDEIYKAFETIEYLYAKVEVLERVKESAKIIDRLICFEDKIYEVRRSEGKGWDGPLVESYGKACADFISALTAYSESERKGFK